MAKRPRNRSIGIAAFLAESDCGTRLRSVAVRVFAGERRLRLPEVSDSQRAISVL